MECNHVTTLASFKKRGNHGVIRVFVGRDVGWQYNHYVIAEVPESPLLQEEDGVAIAQMINEFMDKRRAEAEEAKLNEALEEVRKRSVAPNTVENSNGKQQSYFCGSCGARITRASVHCWKCGRAVKWEV